MHFVHLAIGSVVTCFSIFYSRVFTTAAENLEIFCSQYITKKRKFQWVLTPVPAYYNAETLPTELLGLTADLWWN